MASVTAVDECIGRVVKAVESSPEKDNTIIVVTSDHGWNMGEKGWLFKNSLWEESCRVPMIIVAPGYAKGKVVKKPVSLVDVFPTLVDLCGMEKPAVVKGAVELSGSSMRPLMKDGPSDDWEGSGYAISVVRGDGATVLDHHWTIRSSRWRYIRYANGKEELYDHVRDPGEWMNLAEKKEFKGEKEKMRAALYKELGVE